MTTFLDAGEPYFVALMILWFPLGFLVCGLFNRFGRPRLTYLDEGDAIFKLVAWPITLAVGLWLTLHHLRRRSR